MHQGTERSPGEQQQTYQKRLSEIETLQEHIKRDQIKYEHERNEYEHQIDKKKDHVEQLKSDYVRLVKEIASRAVFSRSGKAISNQVNHPFCSKGQLSTHIPTNFIILSVIFLQDWRTPPRNFSLVGIFRIFFH